MDVVRVELGASAYDVVISEGLFAGGSWRALLEGLAADGGPPFFVSDEHVWRLYGDLFDGFGSAVVAPGEEHKTLADLSALFDAFASSRLSRGGLVVAFGGGVVGDMAGFAAACWMRGVRFCQIPTTLLAMVDSSVGGKTAVDIPAGKNLVGAFHQPSLVLCDPAFLATLPEREIRSGMAEVVKTGAIASEALFGQVAASAAAAAAASVSASLIAACIRFKAGVVAEDEREGGLRKILNFGHTFGHAIEVKYGFSRYTHGEAVAAGMRLAAALGERLGVTEKGTAARLGEVLDACGLKARESAEGLLPYMRGDKKSSADGVDLVLLKRIGEPAVTPLSFAALEDALDGGLAPA
ncbi:MAG: 3-dehydroquinate synthase [Clostridiales Family XIII bacterium]|jgi:3-dehydroquinate synthase|nr:3-dehydroquinate synthase [Clostridiales Family XIII bacterium]